MRNFKTFRTLHKQQEIVRRFVPCLPCGTLPACSLEQKSSSFLRFPPPPLLLQYSVQGMVTSGITQRPAWMSVLETIPPPPVPLGMTGPTGRLVLPGDVARKAFHAAFPPQRLLPALAGLKKDAPTELLRLVCDQ
jgi:hypothetical protein